MRCMNRWAGIGVGAVMGVVLLVTVVMAGNLEPSGGPTAAGSQMYTLDQIYDLINNGTVAPKKTTFTEPAASPTSPTMHTLDDIYALLRQRAPVSKTGQTLSYATGDDGDLRKGVAWPNPRFTDNGNGTVTDNLTGLIWLREANCTNFFTGDSTGVNNRDWASALIAASSLTSGRCGLTDGSKAGDWRLPHVKELHSLIGYAFFNPALSNSVGNGKWIENDPFTGVLSERYWSSSTAANSAFDAWGVNFEDGFLFVGGKSSPFYYLWPVRGGQ